MKQHLTAFICLGIATVCPAQAQVGKVPFDRSTLHVQVILDKLGFSPGVLDGKGGESLKAALRGYQTSRGLNVTGASDAATMRSLAAYRAWRPTVQLALDEATLRGPFTGPLPKDYEQLARYKTLTYKNVMEALAERFHTTPATLIALNGGGTRLAPGVKVLFPNALPTSRAYDTPGDDRWKATLAALNVEAKVPQADRVVVDKSEGVLKAYAGDRLVAQFPATMGSARDPLPLGKWTIKGSSYNPPWQYNPAILKTADKSDSKQTIQPGPNNPVGVIWMDLSKEHYGIHGTNEPAQIGRAESNGCIRLTNWDAARLSLMVKPGTPAVFQA